MQTIPSIIIVMGVAGSGKTEVGKLLSQHFHYQFEDADSFHSKANIEKMKSGHPLTDEDRTPWLESLAAKIERWTESNQPTVLACSALKQSYRNILQQHNTNSKTVRFIYLKGSYQLFLERLHARKGHYMKEDMLKSQFETLEEPDQAIVVDASRSLEDVVSDAISALTAQG